MYSPDLLCPFCHTAPEDINHVWICPFLPLVQNSSVLRKKLAIAVKNATPLPLHWTHLILFLVGPRTPLLSLTLLTYSEDFSRWIWSTYFLKSCANNCIFSAVFKLQANSINANDVIISPIGLLSCKNKRWRRPPQSIFQTRLPPPPLAINSFLLFGRISRCFQKFGLGRFVLFPWLDRRTVGSYDLFH